MMVNNNHSGRCKRGHIVPPDGRYASGQCKQCSRENQVQRLLRQPVKKRKPCRKGHDVHRYGRGKDGRCNVCRNPESYGYAPERRAEIEQDRSNKILLLIDAKDQAGTTWEREDIQREIDRLSSRRSEQCA